MAAIARRQGQSYAKCRLRMQQSYVAWKRLVNGDLRQIRPKSRQNGRETGTGLGRHDIAQRFEPFSE
jgi:hypothetical protein